MTYGQDSGYLYYQNDLIGTGWSGRNIQDGVLGRNNSAAQDVHAIGPIPVGWYTIGPAYDSPTKGPVTMTLTPDPDNQMFGRGDFEIHGYQIGTDPDDPYNPSSDGCIIMERSAREKIAEQIRTAGDNRLQVVSTWTI